MMKEFEQKRDEQLSQIDHRNMTFREYKAIRDRINKNFDMQIKNLVPQENKNEISLNYNN